MLLKQFTVVYEDFLIIQAIQSLSSLYLTPNEMKICLDSKVFTRALHKEWICSLTDYEITVLAVKCSDAVS